MADLKAQLELSADASGVEAGVGKAKKSLASLGATAQAEGAKAAKGVESIGAGGDAAAAKVDRSTRSLINSIQRTTATLEAGGRTSAKYFETLASQRGVDTGALKPYLDQLEAVRQKQAEATAALLTGSTQFNKYGQSAKQTAAALRGVPAQLTDIIVGLQGGQAPLTVLLQQGGQLRDMFGGIVPAARALGGAVLGLVNPFTLAAGAVAALGFAYFQGSKEADAYAKALILTGNAAGATVGQLNAMAQRIDAITGTQAAAAAALAEFAANGNIAANNIERFTLIAIRMEKDAGQSVKETVKQFAELGKSPVEAAVKLNETTNFLTTSIYQQIRALDEQGRTAEAAALAQKSYADALEGRLAQATQRLGILERAWRGIVGAAKDAWDAMLNVGRPGTLQDQLAQAEAQLEQRMASGGPRRGSNRTQGQYDAATQALRDRIEVMKESLRLENSVADRQRESAAQVKARIEFDKAGEQFLDNRAKMEKAITEARNQGLAAGASQEEIEKRIAAIREKYRDKKGENAARLIDRAELNLDVQSIRNASEQLIGTYANSERILESLRSSGLISDREYYESKRAFINLEAQAREDALKKEIERYQQEKLTGKDRIDNERKIAEATSKLAMTRAEAAGRLIILTNQEEAAARRLASAYLTARQAAQEYLDTLQRQQNREIAGIGRGDRQRQIDSGLNQIEDRYGAQRLEAENRRAQLELEGRFTEEARALYEQQIALINEYQGKAIQIYLESVERRKAAEADWANGASEAVNNYLDRSRNVADQVADAFTRAFQGMEDALVKFITTGKLDFKSLADSIIADITRIIVKQEIMRAIGLPGASGGGGWLTGLIGTAAGALFGTGGTAAVASAMPGDSLQNFLDLNKNFGTGRAIGGPVSRGRIYPVNERRPELLDVGGKQYLMMGNQSGQVKDVAGAGRAVNITVHQNFPQNITRATTLQAASDARRVLESASRNM
jgi:lambda family phage tail tape measure protein